MKEGHVTLTGTVRTTAEKTRAAHLANVSGVVSVINKIEVDPKIDQSKIDTAADKTKSGVNKAVDATEHAAEKTKEGVEKGVGKTEEGVGKAADSTADALHKTSAKMSDAALTTKVKSRLSDESLLKGSAIDVDTSNHVVTLKGTVASSGGKDSSGHHRERNRWGDARQQPTRRLRSQVTATQGRGRARASATTADLSSQ